MIKIVWCLRVYSHAKNSRSVVMYEVKLGFYDRNGQLISYCFKSILYFMNRIRWKGVAGQSLSYPCSYVFNGYHSMGKASIEYSMYRRRPEHDVQHMAICYFFACWYLKGYENKAQSLSIKCHKCPICFQITVDLN